MEYKLLTCEDTISHSPTCMIEKMTSQISVEPLATNCS
jgi:hypothetical protein